jgi:hypothetical protein
MIFEAPLDTGLPIDLAFLALSLMDFKSAFSLATFFFAFLTALDSSFLTEVLGTFSALSGLNAFLTASSAFFLGFSFLAGGFTLFLIFSSADGFFFNF